MWNRSVAKPAFVAAVCLFLAACAAPSDQSPKIGVAIPPAFVAPAGTEGPVDDRWWTRFGDPQLTGFVERAVADSPAVRQAAARVRQARAHADIAGADRLPQVDATFSATKRRLSLESLGIVVPGEEAPEGPSAYTIETYDLSANVSWEIDLWGKLSAQSAAARAAFLSSEANLQAARQAVAAQTARTYFAVVEAQDQVELAEETAANYAEVARQIGNRMDIGSAQPIEGELAAANLRSARANLEQRRETLARLTREFEIIMRDYPDGDVAAAAKLPPVPPAPPAGVPAELLSRRPDVAASLLDLQAAGYRLTAAERSFLPSIELTGSAGTSSMELSNLLDPDFFVWSIAGRLLQPIFQGGRLRAQFELRAGERDEALQTYADTVLTALSEVETALAVEEFLVGQQRELAAASAAAERAVEISRNRYEVGKEPLLTLLESQQRALDARSTLLAVHRLRLANRVDLHLALGGAFDSENSMPEDGGSLE
ncbi:efflux transporter outer membrane subunit [Pelagerythrobacter rhizovicinus]|uniref:Efflux transporter outer membrane subunit n=1 Tax=Pelagerythrobacter rhizovicinus TaxID=2268576 RepID=A0A4Q2KMM7_9SPHN|nr:efflux transporter outer membrane subunit [Pelagerythrobacter rhizovicinus]RXZ66595.1 efflux transporter outer membrane subunit [Pelagerythrobacter rhizovicinus]